MRPKSMILIVIAMGCGLIASIGISQVIERRNQSTNSSTGEMKEIFVAMVDVPVGEPLTAQTIKLEEWPVDKIPEGAITTAEEIEGRRPMLPLYEGEPILLRKLIDQNTRIGASERIPPGYRVMSVKVTTDSAASGLILPGDRVDVLVYLRKSDGISSPMTKTILTDVTVFAVNEHINRDVEGDVDGSTIQARTVSLLVKPDQVERLNLAENLGKLRLSLRRADDKTKADTPGADLHDLYAGQSATLERPTDALAQTSPQSPLLGLLNQMGSSSASPVADAYVHKMAIHTSEGVQFFHWDDANELPRELQTTSGVPSAGIGPSGDGSPVNIGGAVTDDQQDPSQGQTTFDDGTPDDDTTETEDDTAPTASGNAF